MRWLKEEARGMKVYALMAESVVLSIIYSFSVVIAAHFLGISISPVGNGKVQILTLYFPIFLASAVFAEEALFRLPLAIFIDRGWPVAKIMGAALLLSAAFGFIHGGIRHILVQGGFGFILSVMFLKCGGLKKNYLKAIAVTTASHLLFDAVLVGIALLAGKTSL